MIIKKAGAIILSKKDPSSILLLYQDQHHDWSFPKGHVELGETGEEAARREVKEETGLSVEIISSLTMMNYVHPNGNPILLEMYLVQSKNDDDLQLEKVGDEFAWINFQNIEEKLTYQNTKNWFRENIVEVVNRIRSLQQKSS